MSDSEILYEIQRLRGYAERLENLLCSMDELNFTQFKTAGTGNWSGNVKSSKFDNEYKKGSNQLDKAAQEIEEAILACQSKMRSLASSIDFTDSPWQKAEAEAMAYAPII